MKKAKGRRRRRRRRRMKLPLWRKKKCGKAALGVRTV
jgi:hypothetical protein